MLKTNNTYEASPISVLGLLLFAIPFSVSIFPVTILYILAISLIFINFPRLLKASIIDKKLITFLLFMLSPSIVGILSLLPSLLINTHNMDYGELSIWGRIFNLLLFPTVILIMHYQIKKQKSLLLFKWLWWGGLVFIFFGVWHALAIYGPINNFPFETRSHVHSAGELVTIGGERVTGVAREPSYFGPFVVDFMILTLLLVYSKFKRLTLLVLATLLIILSLSPSGFLVLGGAITGGIIVVTLRYIIRLKLSTHIIHGFLAFILAIPFLYYFLNTSFWDYIAFRFSSVDESGRFYMNIMPFLWSSESNIFSFLFGNGVKSYSIIGTQYFLPNGTPVHITSNNLFVDMFWESGLFGLILVLSFYFYCFLKIITSRLPNYQLFLAGAILFDLFFSGFVRADFATLRVFIMFYLLFLLLNYDIKNSRRTISWHQ